MVDDILKQFGSWMFIVVFIGSIVDLFQFSWIIKRQTKRFKRAIYAKVKREILMEQYLRGKSD